MCTRRNWGGYEGLISARSRGEAHIDGILERLKIFIEEAAGRGDVKIRAEAVDVSEDRVAGFVDAKEAQGRAMLQIGGFFNLDLLERW